jgi:hypothetical protein
VISVRGAINETNHQADDHPFREVSDPLLHGDYTNQPPIAVRIA